MVGMELISSWRRPMTSLGGEVGLSPGPSLQLAVSLGVLTGPPVRFLNRSAKGGITTTCKYNGNRRRPAGKSVQEKQKEFALKKEELLRRSRGESVKEIRENGGASETLALVNEFGALSVSVLQPIEEVDYPIGNRIALNSLNPQILENSLSKSFSQFVSEKAAREDEEVRQFKKSGAARSTIEHTVTRKVEQKLTVTASAVGEESDAASDGDEEDDEWVEVDLDDVDEEAEEEIVEFWEGDLPPMTPEEEEELLREAELEIAELERQRLAGIDPALVPDTDVELERVEKKQKLEELKSLVKQMEEELAKENGVTESPRASSYDVNGKSVEKTVHTFNGEKGGGKVDHVVEEEVDEDEYGIGGSDSHSIDSDEIRIESKRISVDYRRKRAEDFWDDEDEGEEITEERGVPAVMRCFDRAKIYLKAGDGGNGVVAFRREKYVPFGGPYGGTGGRGGHIYFEADPAMNSLLPFRRAVHFRAGRGSHGGGKRKEGASGTDFTVKVPPGTLIKEAGPGGKVLLEMTKPGHREMLLPGGAGGRGNAAFKTGRNNAPQMAEFGEQGVEMWVELELKLVADVGIVGVPNAGKSTLLSAISAAKPEIANYPFTTLLPNLGVVALDYDATMVVADLPGLLEGAHAGIGLGHEFLRHTERCTVLIHVVDGISLQPVEEFEAVRLELQLFNPVLSEKPFVVAFNKMDIPEAAERWDEFQQSLRTKGVEPFCMSAATQDGTSEVIRAAYELLKKQKASALENYTKEKETALAVAQRVKKQRSAPIENFTINADTHTRTWQVVGAGLERFTQMTNWEYFESMRRFQHVLTVSGVNKALRERGVQEGDTVIVGQMEFSWIDSEDMSALKDWKRGVRGSKVWPH